MTEVEARNLLASYTQQIVLLEWGGKTISKSKFKNLKLGVEFERDFAGVIKALKKGQSLDRIGCGKGGAHPQRGSSKRGQYRARLEELNVSNVSQLPEIKEKKEQTFLARYGETTNLKLDATKQKIRVTNLAKYGHSCSLHGGIGKQKKLESWKRFEGGMPLTDPEVRSKIAETRIATGTTYQVSGKTLKEWAEELGVGYSTFQSTLKYEGFDAAMSLRPNRSHYETLIQSWFPKEPVILNKQLTGTTYRPDLVWPKQKIIVEVDGLYWHSDAVNSDRRYHATKREAYQAAGYLPLFIRTDELTNTPDIVRSVISHKLGYTPKKLFARKGTLHKVNKSSFFHENHLMGKGSGAIFLLSFGGVPKAGMQVRWKDRKQGILEISRFCTEMNTSVVGGFSKLLKNVVDDLRPKQVITFCDLRYGRPDHLVQLGFVHKNTSLSFMWTDGKQTWHRRKFLGNSGYEKGLYKIWDCGQALYAFHPKVHNT